MTVLGYDLAYSKKVIGTMPKDVDIEVFLSPSPAPWNYVPEPPYWIVRRAFGPYNMAAFYGWEQNIPTDVDAIDSFSRRHMPRPEQWGYIVDGYHQIAIGWRHMGDLIEWEGCEFMFGLLAASPYVQAAEIAIYETAAKERSVALTTLKEALNVDITRPS